MRLHKAMRRRSELAMKAMEFEFRVAGELSASVLEEIEGVHVVAQSQETILQGPVLDQAALIGIINRLQGLGVELRGVRQLGTDHRPSPVDPSAEG